MTATETAAAVGEAARGPRVLICVGAYCPEAGGEGAWGAVFTATRADGGVATKAMAGYDPVATPRRLALLGIRACFAALKKPAEVALAVDQDGVANIIRQGWLPKWEAAGWTKGKNGRPDARKPVEDWQLWALALEEGKRHAWALDDGATGGAGNGPHPALRYAQIVARAEYIGFEFERLKTEAQARAEGGPVALNQVGAIHMFAERSGYTKTGLLRMLAEHGTLSARDVTVNDYRSVVNLATSPTMAAYFNALRSE